MTKQNKVIKENYGKQSDEFMDFISTDNRELLESSTTNAINESTTFDEDQVMCDVTRKHVYQNLSGSWFRIKNLRLYIQNMSCLQRSKP